MSPAIDRSFEEMAELASTSAAQMIGRVPNFRELPKLEQSLLLAKALNTPDQVTSRLEHALSHAPTLQGLRDGWIQTGWVGRQVQAQSLPYLVVMAAIDGASVQQLLTEAVEFSETKQCQIELYTPVAGAVVSSSASITSTTDLVPWASVPSGQPKADFDRNRWGTLQSLPVPAYSAFVASPNSAIRSRLAPSNILFASSEQGREAETALRAEFNDTQEAHQDIVRCLTILTGGAIAAVGYWMHFDRDIVNRIAGGGYAFSYAMHESAVHHSSIRPFDIDQTALTQLTSAFISLPAPTQKTMRVAIDRLNQSLRRTTIVDRFIDLGTSLEVMLLHGVGNKERGELKYRAAVRAAAYLGGEKAERVRVFNLMRNAYDLRSAAVHAGVVGSKQSQEGSYQVLQEATQVCVRLAKRIIEQGGFPDWDVDYVVGQSENKGG